MQHRAIELLEYPVKWITENIAVGYAPRSRSDLETIRSQGISAIVNLCAECYDLNELEKRADFDVFYLPLPDEGAPDIAHLEETLAWIEAYIADGMKVLIHCRYGIGRAGTVVIAYLFKKGLSLRHALNIIKHTPSIPMSHQQWRLLREYSEKLGLPKAHVLEAQSEIVPESGVFFKKWAAMQKWFNAE